MKAVGGGTAGGGSAGAHSFVRTPSFGPLRLDPPLRLDLSPLHLPVNLRLFVDNSYHFRQFCTENTDTTTQLCQHLFSQSWLALPVPGAPFLMVLKNQLSTVYSRGTSRKPVTNTMFCKLRLPRHRGVRFNTFQPFLVVLNQLLAWD